MESSIYICDVFQIAEENSRLYVLFSFDLLLLKCWLFRFSYKISKMKWYIFLLISYQNVCWIDTIKYQISVQHTAKKSYPIKLKGYTQKFVMPVMLGWCVRCNRSFARNGKETTTASITIHNPFNYKKNERKDINISAPKASANPPRLGSMSDTV
jgi:hypothetical protein